MGVQSISRAELLAELFTRIENITEPDPIPSGWFTPTEYIERQAMKGVSRERARKQLYAAHKAGLLGRCQRRGHMWYYEKKD